MKQWQILAGAGLIGVASLALVPFETLVRTPFPPLMFRLLSLIQPAVLVLAATVAGAFAAPRVGLDSPLTAAWVRGERGSAVLRRQTGPALLVALLTAGVLLLYGATVEPRLAALAEGPAKRLADFGLPLVTRLLYGGLTEELMTRWG